MSKLVKVKAGTTKAGTPLVVFFPQRVITAPGRRTLSITGDQVAEVDPNQLFVRKRLRVGDLVIVKETKVATRKTTSKKPKGNE